MNGQKRAQVDARISSNVKAIRTFLGLSQDEFGALIGYDKTYVSKIESGVAPATPKFVQALVDRFGVKVQDMYGLDFGAKLSSEAVT